MVKKFLTPATRNPIYEVMARNEHIGQLVRKLGGPHYVARCLGRKPSAVVMWRIDGSIPHRWRPALLNLAELRGVKLSKVEKRLLEIESVIDIPPTQ